MSRILVVEEQPGLQRFYREELSRDGDVVMTAGDEASAVRDFELDPPDLVLINLGPPGAALRIVERLFALDRGVPIVLNATCRAYEDDPLGWAVDAYLIKSPDTGELRATVRNLLNVRASRARPSSPPPSGSTPGRARRSGSSRTTCDRGTRPRRVA